MSRKILKSTAVVSFMTLLSRISGLIRDIIMANVLGSGAVTDAFFVAFRIPNFLRRIFGEGAFSQAFVPVFTELRATGDAEARAFIGATAGRLGLIVLLLSIAGVLTAPWLVYAFAPGFADHPDKYAMAVEALRIMFPYLFFISLVAMSGAVLNTLQRFAVPAATPVLLNLCFILALLLLVPAMDNAARALAIGVLIAGVVQLLFQLPSLLRSGVLSRPTLQHNEGTKKVFSLMIPAIIGVSGAQINTLVNTWLASFLVTGSISWLYYADRLMEFPVAVFGIALATVVLPSLSREYQHGTEQSFAKLLDWGLRWVVMIATPAAVALALLALPLLATMFQYNQFTSQDTQQAALALRAYSVGVVAFILIKVLAPGFYARQDTKTPVRIAMMAIALNIALSLLFIGPLKHAGLALAMALAAWLNAGLLGITLWRRGIYQVARGWGLFIARVGLSVAAMVGILLWLSGDGQFWLNASFIERVQRLVLVVVAGAASYFVCLYCVGLRPHQLLLAERRS